MISLVCLSTVSQSPTIVVSVAISGRYNKLGFDAAAAGIRFSLSLFVRQRRQCPPKTERVAGSPLAQSGPWCWRRCRGACRRVRWHWCRCRRVCGWNSHHERVRELFAQPDPILLIDVEAVVRMAACRIERERTSANRERTKLILHRVVKPNQALAIGFDARGMLAAIATGRGIRVFGHPVIRPRAGSGDIQRADGRDPAFGPPDVAVWIDRDQVRNQACASG